MDPGLRTPRCAGATGGRSLTTNDFARSSAESKVVRNSSSSADIRSMRARCFSTCFIASIMNIISNRISRYVTELEAEFSESPFRLDLNQLTVVADRPERPVPMNKTGGGSNHLAYHLGALLALHYFASQNRKPIPSFLFLDQPTQVYFPSEQIYKSASGSVEETERDSDLEKVRKLFLMLYRFATEESPGFQIIVTEHANLRDDWFQKSIVETPWTKPPALIPDNWPTHDGKGGSR